VGEIKNDELVDRRNEITQIKPDPREVSVVTKGSDLQPGIRPSDLSILATRLPSTAVSWQTWSRRDAPCTEAYTQGVHSDLTERERERESPYFVRKRSICACLCALISYSFV
jgi:hypothetical protein